MQLREDWYCAICDGWAEDNEKIAIPRVQLNQQIEFLEVIKLLVVAVPIHEVETGIVPPLPTWKTSTVRAQTLDGTNDSPPLLFAIKLLCFASSAWCFSLPVLVHES